MTREMEQKKKKSNFALEQGKKQPEKCERKRQRKGSRSREQMNEMWEEWQLDSCVAAHISIDDEQAEAITILLVA